MQWLNCNPKATIIAENKVPQYYNYSMGIDPSSDINFVPAFTKLTYKDLYPGVDVIYQFKDDGIKYALKIYPSADPSQIKMKYVGANGVKLDSDGNIHISTPVGDIIDHSPQTYYESNLQDSIESAFILDGDVVSFKLNSYSSDEVIIIDPWTVNPNFTNDNIAFDIQHDMIGNSYVHGGLNPYKLKKFDPSGTLLWTTNSLNNGQRPGDIATDGSGITYFTAGHNGGGLVPSISKIDPTGIILWNNTINFTREFWALVTKCDGSRVVVGDSYPGGFLS